MQEGARRWRHALPLLAPALLLSLYGLILPLLTFLRFSFDRYHDGEIQNAFVLGAYREFLTDPYEHAVILNSLRISLLVTLAAVAISYPLAYALWRLDRRPMQKWLALIIFSPILVSVVVRSYGWIMLLDGHGPVNFVLTHLFLSRPVRLLYTGTGVVISLTHVLLPFVVFPIFATMVRLDPAIKDAARDLGAGPWTTFRRITFPLTLPGLIGGAEICFSLALGAFVTPSILGGGRVLVLSLEIFNNTTDINWPTASVGNLILLLLAFAAIALFHRLLRLSAVH